MSDFNSSLPIRTETAGDVIAKIADATTPSQQLAIDASGNAQTEVNNAGGASAVNIQDGGNSLTVDAVNLDIRDLAFATDKVDASGSTNVAVVDGGGSLTVDATDLDIRNLVFATDKVDASGSSNVAVVDGGGSLTVDAVDLDIRNLVFATDKVDVSGSTGLVATVSATDLDIRDLTHVSDSVKIGDGSDFLAINADGSINVSISDSTPGTPVNDYKAASAIAAAASDNHDYTVTALKTLTLNQIEGAASGKAKMVVQVETAVASGVFTTRFTKFNSTANPNMEVSLSNPISVAAGVRVRVVMTNLDNQAQDLYSTISGFELP